MSPVTIPRFELRRTTHLEWEILDLSLPEHDPRRLAARIYEVDDLEYDVLWLRDVNLPTTYMSPHDALRDVRRVTLAPRPGPHRPVEIPHLPPLTQRVPA